MAWRIEFDRGAAKELARLDRDDARRILAFLKGRVAGDPRSLGGPLHGPAFGEFWRYRVWDFRILCRLEDGRMTVLAVRIAHRRVGYH